MAKKVYIDFELRYKEAVANLDEMQKEYTKLENKVQKYDKSVDKTKKSTKAATGSTVAFGGVINTVTGGAIARFTALKASILGVAAGFKTVRVALIASGIGALALVLVSIVAAFKRSEEGQNKFAKIMSVIGSVVNEVMDILATFGMALIDVFSQPGKIWDGFVNILKTGYEFIKKQVFERLVASITVAVGGFQKMILKARIAWNKFTGDSEEATKLSKQLEKVEANIESAKNKLDGLNDSLIDTMKTAAAEAFLLGKITKEQFDAQVKRFKEEAKISADIADQRAKADKLERKLQVERAVANRKIAELREQAANKEGIAVEDRIAALEEAGRIEAEITNKEIAAARIRFEAKQRENALGLSTKKDLDEEAQLKAKLIELETGRLRLQKALTAEITTALREAETQRKQEAAELEANYIFLPGVGFVSKEAYEKAKAQGDAIEKIQEEFRKKAEDDAAETEVQKLELEKSRKLQELDNLNATEEQKANIIAFYRKKIDTATDKANDEQDKKDDELAKDKEARLKQTVGNLISIVGANSKFGKGIAAANAIRDTFAGANKAFSQGGIFGFVQAAAIIASGLKNVKTIMGTKDPSPQGIAGARSTGSEPAISIPSSTAESIPPQFDTVGASGVNQLAQALGGGQSPIRAFVVSGDVSTAQEMDRNIVSSASLG